MNDRQIDSLLEQMKTESSPALDCQAEEAILNGLHDGIRRRRRMAYGLMATVALVLVCLICTIGGKTGRNSGQEPEAVAGAWSAEEGQAMLAELELEQLFQETGVACVNGEIVTFEHQEEQNGKKLLCLRLAGQDGASMKLEVVIPDNDYLVLKDGPVTGEMLISSCFRK